MGAAHRGEVLAGENMKLAVLLMVIDENKYRGILDSLELRADNPTYAQLKDQIIKHYMRRQSSYEANKDRNAHRPFWSGWTILKGIRGLRLGVIFR